MITFRRFSKQWYWKANQLAGAKDDIMIAGHDWEFCIEQHELQGKPALRVCAFDDALKAFGLQKVCDAVADLQGCTTLDGAELLLERAGLKPVIQQPGTRRK